MAISKVIYGANTLIDLTSDTVTTDKLMKGYTAHDMSGASITGTLTTVNYYSGSDEPKSSIGSDGDIYFKVES